MCARAPPSHLALAACAPRAGACVPRVQPPTLHLRSNTSFDNINGRSRVFSAASSVHSSEGQGERDDGGGRPPAHAQPGPGAPRMLPPGLPSRSSTAPVRGGGSAEALRASATAPAARMSPRVRAALRRSQRRLTNGVSLDDANSVLDAVRSRRRSFLRREVSSGGCVGVAVASRVCVCERERGRAAGGGGFTHAYAVHLPPPP